MTLQSLFLGNLQLYNSLMGESLATGLLLGLWAGIAPGPLLALVIGETLRHGFRAGIRVALAPLITDLPIVLGSLLLVSRLADFDLFLGVISLVGAGFVAYLGVDSLRNKIVDIDGEDKANRSLLRGVLANFLSPHPYLFWLGVGAPTTVKAYEHGPGSAGVFILGFYVLLIGSKICLAVIAGKSRGVLKGRAYRYTTRFLGVALLVFALVLVRDGLSLLGFDWFA